MADISKRTTKSGATTYKVRTRIGKDEATGKILYSYKTFATKKAATEHRNTVGVEVKAGTHIADRDSITIGQALDQWLWVCEHVGRGKNGPVEKNNTLPKYKLYVGVLREHWGSLKLNKLSRPKMIEIRDALVKEFSRAMARKYLTTLKMALNEAQDREQIVKDVGRRVTIVKSSRESTEVAIPQIAEAQALRQAAYDCSVSKDLRIREAWAPRYRLMIELLMATGVRPSELFGLARSGVKLSVKPAYLRVEQRADCKGEIGDPKTRAGWRNIRISARLAADLAEWMKRVPAAPDSLVFATRKGRAPGHVNFSHRCWYPLQLRAKVVTMAEGEDGVFVPKPKYDLYALRHFFASCQIKMGTNPKLLQQMMGHEKIETTMNIYGHLFDVSADEAEAIAERMDNQLLGPIVGLLPGSQPAQIRHFEAAE